MNEYIFNSILITSGDKVLNEDIFVFFYKSHKLLSINTWINLFPFLEQDIWKEFFLLPFKISGEPFYQSFQYKVLHRTLNCKENLFKWEIIESSTCRFYRTVDTLEHHLYYCNISIIFWKELSKWCKHILKVKFKFTVCEALFGLQLREDPYNKLCNFNWKVVFEQ